MYKYIANIIEGINKNLLLTENYSNKSESINVSNKIDIKKNIDMNSNKLSNILFKLNYNLYI